MIAGQHDSSLLSDNNVNRHKESDRYEVKERKRLSIEHECLVKQLFMVCTLIGFQRFLLSQKISPYLSSEERMLVPDANDFTSLWEICKGKFKWCDRALLRHLLHYVPKCNHDMVQEIICKLEKNQLSAFMPIPYKHVELGTDQAIQKQNPGPGVNQQERFIEEAKRESRVTNDHEGELVIGRYRYKVDFSSTSVSQTLESQLLPERDITLQSTVNPFFSKYPSPPIPQSLIRILN